MDKEKITKAKKILDLERKKGFSNRAVLGGLESFMKEHFDQQELLHKIEGYSEQTSWQREQTIETIENLLTGNSWTSSKKGWDSVDQPIEKAKGVGEQRGKLFRKIGVETVEDLLFFLPRKLEDRREEKKIKDLRVGDKVTITGEIKTAESIRTRKDFQLVKAAVEDKTGVCYAVWFNQPWIKKQLDEDKKVALYGKITKNYGEIQMENPTWEPLTEKESTRKLVPIYPSTEELSQKTIRWIVNTNLDQFLNRIPQYAPPEIASRHDLFPLRKALKKIHNPNSENEFRKARKSIAFSELFLFNYGLKTNKKNNRPRGEPLKITEGDVAQFVNKLPFTLTSDQTEILNQVVEDLTSERPMNRLLQGDVGSGKTVVAAGAGYLTSLQGSQVALMAPTTILASQHFHTLKEIFQPFNLNLSLVTGKLSPSEKKETRTQIASGETDFIVGTHALLQDQLTFSDLRLVIIDEEQRFGVAQRSDLTHDEGKINTLVMSATPIPRTITSTLYGQFDVSTLTEMPRGEKNIETYWVSEGRRDEIYENIKTELGKGKQAYIVFPLVEESDKLDLKSAVQMKQNLSDGPLKDFRLGLLHGRMDDEEKERVLQKFKGGELQVLVTTTVIEVGIDVADVSLLIIEHADRFGLSQLHQLRGRIGRNGQPACCYAIGSPSTDEGRQRLEAFRDIDDGFKLVEEDLKIRGPGDLLGPLQHGFKNSFKACNLIRDLDMMNIASEEAEKYTDAVGNDKKLKLLFDKRFKEKMKWIKS